MKSRASDCRSVLSRVCPHVEVEWLEPRRLLSVVPIKDFGLPTPSSSPASFTDVNGTTYFTAVEPNGMYSDTTRGLWKTDGTAGNTSFIRQVPAVDLTSGLGKLFFFSGVSSLGQLWTSDGTATGTKLVFQLPGTATGSNLTPAGGSVYFAVKNGNSSELWKTDGTASGTVKVSATGQFAAGTVSNLTDVNGTLYFTARDTAHGNELWRSDGTSTGMTLVDDLTSGPGSTQFTQLLAVGSRLYFGINGSIWVTDGTAAGTLHLADANNGLGGLIQFNGAVYFTGRADVGSALWKTIPGSVTAVPIARFSSFPARLHVINGALVFLAVDSDFNQELWRSDGSTLGTVPVAAVGRLSNTEVATGNLLYFTAVGATPQLWRSDGTAAGTFAIDAAPSNLMNAAAGAGRLLFSADDGVHGQELWRSEGTDAGTSMVRDLDNATLGAMSPVVASVGGRLYFEVTLQNQSALWQSDGTPDGTTILSQFGVNPAASAYPTWFDDRLYFATQGQLWNTDGTSGDFGPVADVAGGPQGRFTQVTAIAPSGGALYFAGANDSGTVGLWRITSPGQQPTLVAPLPVSETADLDGALLFLSQGKLYRTDGTEAGTVEVAPGAAFANPHALQVLNNRVYFRDGADLWQTDGTAAGTTKDVTLPAPAFLTPINGAFYFFAADTTGTLNLWRSDGTSGGTGVVRAIGPAPSGALPTITTSGGALYFVANAGKDLWRSDGTAAGTAVLKSFTGPLNDLVDNVGTLFFQNGVSLWRTDGTAAGTVAVTAAGDTPTGGGAVVAAGGAVFFTNTSRSTGNTIFEVPASAPPAAPAEFSVSAATSREVDLRWTGASAAASGYRVQRSTDPTFAKLDFSVTVPDGYATYSDTGVDPSTQYYYRIVAYNSGGSSAAVTTTATTAAGVQPPHGLTATAQVAVGSVAVRLQWSDDSTDRTGFRIERSSSFTFDTIDFSTTVSADTTSYTDTTTLPQTTYLYRVVAIGAGSESAPVTASIAVPLPIPAAPASLIATSHGENDVQLDWSVSPDYATGFHVESRDLNGGPWQLLVASIVNPSTPLIDVFVPLGSRYAFRVQPFNSSGAGPYSPEASASDVPLGSPVVPLSANAGLIGLTEVNNKFVFASADPTHGLEPWVSDGTPAGTMMLQDIVPGSEGSFAGGFVTIGSLSYFVARDSNGDSIWKTDGTPDGTTRVAAIPTLAPPGGFASLTVAGNLIFFLANATLSGADLWRSDGTPAGTLRVAQVPGEISAPLTAVGAKVCFTVTNDSNALDLWTSDGTAAGTGRVKNLFASANSPQVFGLTAVGSQLFFFVKDGSSNTLWKSDGTDAGTALVSDFGRDVPVSWAAVGGRLFFGLSQIHNQIQSYALMKSDGTPAGTEVVYDGSGRLFAVSSIVEFNGLAWFLSAANGGGSELWRSDGTTQGTMRVGGKFQSAQLSPQPLVGKLFIMTAGDLYQTDGTAAGISWVSKASLNDLVEVLGGTVFYTSSSFLNEVPGTYLSEIATTPPAAPTAVTATRIDPRQAGVAWVDASSNESGFYIDRIRVGGDGSESVEQSFYVPPNATSYTDVGLSDGVAYRYRVRAFNAAGGSASDEAALPSVVYGRRIFYNNSSFDGNDSAANAADDNAVASAGALLPGGTATGVNYTGYSRGINGIFVDIAGLTGQLTPDDFVLRVGNSNDTGTWAAAPPPSAVAVRFGDPAALGADRVDITWPDNAIQNEWLQVTVKADARTGLAAPDVFYFGNAIGDTFDSKTDAIVSAADVAAVRAHPRNYVNPAPIFDRYDINRDGRVNATDQLIVRAHYTDASTALQLITPAQAAAAKAITLSASDSSRDPHKPVRRPKPRPHLPPVVNRKARQQPNH